MDHQHTRPSFWKTPFGIVATLSALVASGYLYLVHKDHVLALLPYAFLAACPLMHIFMHRGHGPIRLYAARSAGLISRHSEETGERHATSRSRPR